MVHRTASAMRLWIRVGAMYSSGITYLLLLSCNAAPWIIVKFPYLQRDYLFHQGGDALGPFFLLDPRLVATEPRKNC
jgi:hypothetical protein